MSWVACHLGDVLTLKRGYDLPTRLRRAGPVPVVSSSGITGHHDEAKVRSPAVVTGRYGTLGNVYYVDQDCWPLNTALYVVDFHDTHKRFAAYFLKNALQGYRSDKAAVPGVDRNVLHRLDVRVPDLATQRTIAATLSAYDDLIENNRRRIQLLERAARLLYREWFVHFRFPGHEYTDIVDGVPDGWEKKTLGEVAPLRYGKALKKTARVPGRYPVYGSSGVIGTHRRALVSGPGIIVGRKGNVGSVYWCPSDYHPIDTVFYIAALQCSLYLYYALRNTHFINTDVAVPGLNRGFANSREVLLPEDRIFEMFEERLDQTHQQIECLSQYSRKLAHARDLLLPRLMSGEISV